jgi:hypothetical protein
MLARAPPWLSAMQKVIAAFVDSNQTPPMELTPWSTCWAQAMQHALNKLDIAPLQTRGLCLAKASERQPEKEVTLRRTQLISCC